MTQRSEELHCALTAVRAASRVCREVQQGLVTADTLQKKDRSPVTVADFASQAIVSAQLQALLPNDLLVGEEDAKELREASQDAIRSAVVDHVRAASTGKPSEADVLAWIDRGNADASTRRYWTLDPIDGTKGFLRGEQYAVALALIEDGEVVLGVLGCPNLPNGDQTGALFSAVRGSTTQSHELWNEGFEGSDVQVAQISSASEARFCESVESAHSNQSDSARIAAQLGITADAFRIDSQCKYAAVARNDASIYLRLPTRKDYQEKIWDHAAGLIVVECAGGRVTDIDGKDLDFKQGRTLANNRGVVATCGSVHDEVIRAIRAICTG